MKNDERSYDDPTDRGADGCVVVILAILLSCLLIHFLGVR